MPSGRLAAVAQKATLRLTATAIHSSGVSVTLSAAASIEGREALAGEDPGAVRAAQGVQETLRLAAPGRRREGRRIDDGRMAGVRKTGDDRNLRLGLGIRLVDEAEGRLAARHEGEGGAHVLAFGEAARNLRPQAELLEGGLAVLAGRHGRDACGRKTAGAERRGERSGGQGDRFRLVGRGDQDDAIAEKV